MSNDNKSTVKIVIAVVAIVAAVSIVVARQSGEPKGRPDQVYFYNLDTAEVYARDRSRLPIDANADGSVKGVAAYVLSCGVCDASQWKVAYVTSVTDAARAQITQAETNADEMRRDMLIGDALAEGTVIGAPAKAMTWLAPDSEQGTKLIMDAENICGSQPPNVCLP